MKHRSFHRFQSERGIIAEIWRDPEEGAWNTFSTVRAVMPPAARAERAMEREVRYCTTEDGVRIAYCVEGEGPTTVLALPAFYESFSLDHLMPVYKQFYADLDAGRRIIRFDWRTTGLSAHVPAGVHGWNTAGLAADLLAVARAAGHPCVVWASTIAGFPAVRFAVAHPELVTHLILYGTYAAVAHAFSDDLVEGLGNLVKVSWQMAAQNYRRYKRTT